jgi:hypothetical protein
LPPPEHPEITTKGLLSMSPLGALRPGNRHCRAMHCRFTSFRGAEPAARFTAVKLVDIGCVPASGRYGKPEHTAS